MSKITLQGITWGHSRGITPLLAAAQRYSELNPNIEITWRKRTLQEFADFPIEKLTQTYDLLIIDHPWVGRAAADKTVLPLDEYLPAEYLVEQEQHSVGYSHLSYNYGGHQWALAIDAATPAASYRPDLIAKHNQTLPDTWEDVLALAKKGKVAVPAIPIDLLMNFYTFCLAHGQEPFLTKSEVINKEIGLKALASMREFYSQVHPQFFEFNPIAVAEIMTQTNDYFYCPFAYCYSNYSRLGYAANTLAYTDTVRFGSHGRLRTTVGGTGLAVSAYSEHQEAALQFAQWLVSPQIQATIYVQHGGQPGHRAAWLNESANQLCQNFFTNILPLMDRGYIRPRYNGYLHFQDHAGDPLQEYLKNGGSPENVLQEINRIYQESLPAEV
ncbi:ABC transporter substrate-binding protein [Adhaeribacter rhizoryzae]|uniref:Extracellular solute-binding protein n=1 Tax=Adhaeribacter rhizoryzae TaxID=2607907 RepID=A0A5M6D3I2_9BACT|nr:extracellular solute-binding protein [Adhaeribacter rhizoryzae]KAA5540852.1 extracellular solute-binding protein [Adhaeribacter rhizoryzae]